MMSINKRILYLRKEILKLNQDKFGVPLGIKKGGLSKIETEVCGVTEANIISICREYNVNEEWLRHGTGDIFKVEKNDLDYLVAKYGDSLTAVQKLLVAAILKMNDKQKEAVEHFFDELIVQKK